jgi:hypothetical protein
MPRAKTKSLISPHQTYYDDSGCGDGKSVTFSWAGYAAPLLFWDKIGDAWNKILDHEPRMEFWHQSKVRAKYRTTDKDNPFKDYDAKDLESREQMLCDLLYRERKSMWAFATHIRNSDIKAHIKGRIINPKWSKADVEFVRPRVMESPHLIALFYAMRRSLILHSKKPEDRMPVSFHCENRDGDKYQDRAQVLWKRLAYRYPEDFGVLDFPRGKSRRSPQLQIADMLAWHVNRRATRGDADEKWRHVQGRELFEDTVSVDELRKHVHYWSNAYHDRLPNPANYITGD